MIERSLVDKQPRAVAQPGPHQVLVRRHADDGREHPQEMKSADADMRRDGCELHGLVRVRIDPERGSNGAAPIRRPDAAGAVRSAGGPFDEARDEHQGRLVEAEIGRTRNAGLDPLAKHHELWQRRQRPTLPDRRSIADLLDELGRHADRETLVTVRVLVCADKFLAREADHYRARDELVRAPAGGAAETALAHVRDGVAAVPFGERRRPGRDVAPVVGHRDGTGMQRRPKGHARMLRASAARIFS